ncbi:MAG: YggT family protein [Psychrobium sp.]|nr:YggT family protein [Psychrobium sp.]
MNALIYLIEYGFSAYLMIVILRVWLQLAKADFYNQLSQFVVKATNSILAPMRRIIPGVLGIDMAGVVLALIVAGAKIALIILLQGGAVDPLLLLVWALILTIKTAGMMVFVVMIVRAILSWVSQGGHPIEMLFGQLTDPLLQPIRRVIPSMGGLDLSMIALFVALNFLNKLFSEFVPYWSSL